MLKYLIFLIISVSVYSQTDDLICVERDVAEDIIILQDSLHNEVVLMDSLIKKQRLGIATIEEKFKLSTTKNIMLTKHKEKYREFAVRKSKEADFWKSLTVYGLPLGVALGYILRGL